jgi:hypothetical protein
MSRNPYAQPETYDAGYAEPTRVSGFAVTSFVLSLICCIPGFGLLGAILGGVAIVRISQAGGRLAGRGLAIAGLIIGLIVTLLWVGLLVGAAQTMAQFQVYGDTLGALDKRDYNRVREMLTPTVAASLTDERLEEFRTAVDSEWGSYQRLPRGLAEWFSAYAQTIQSFSRQQQQHPQSVGTSPLPLPAYYDQGLALNLFVLDPRNISPHGAAQSSNIAIFDQQGNPIWLVPPTTPGPAPRTAPPPAAPPPPADPSPSDPPPAPPPTPTPAEPAAPPAPG